MSRCTGRNGAVVAGVETGGAAAKVAGVETDVVIVASVAGGGAQKQDGG